MCGSQRILVGPIIWLLIIGVGSVIIVWGKAFDVERISGIPFPALIMVNLLTITGIELILYVVK